MAGEKIRSVDILESLSPAEKEVLALLAQGHTAKTIATDLGISLAAVNERLRSARRRAGAGSSRELARQLAQKNRHQFTGLAPVEGEAVNPAGPASSRRRLTRRNIMISGAALAIAAIVGLAAQVDIQTSPQSGPGPDVQAIVAVRT